MTSARLVPKTPVVTPRPSIVARIPVKIPVAHGRSDERIEVLVNRANGLARSSFPGGISTDGVRSVLPRTFNPENPDNTCPPSNEGDAR